MPAAKAVRVEREAYAKIADHIAQSDNTYMTMAVSVICDDIANAIRDRNSKRKNK